MPCRCTLTRAAPPAGTVVHPHSMMGVSMMGPSGSTSDPYAVFNMPADVQRGFRRKVLGILSAQLTVMLVTVLAFLFVGPLRSGLVNSLGGVACPEPSNLTVAAVAVETGLFQHEELAVAAGVFWCDVATDGTVIPTSVELGPLLDGWQEYVDPHTKKL